MDITLYDTRTRAKVRLDPVVPGKASMYVCGPTVYDRAHIGNARPVVVFDTLFRLLRHVCGAGNVTYVRNITDVDDKIIARARESGREIGAITAETTRWYHEDMDALGALRPTFEPRATEHIGGMIAMIALLIERGHAYAAEGHVLFSVGSYADYGKLARRSLEDMRAGARVEVAPYKRDPMDFVLWKPSGEGTPGWDSPWGRGRPGWHIECSAMARALLGGTFDIHGGGVDLAFPHHENELAQSACAHPDEGFARIWMHNGMLNVEGEKMSKSLGNFFTVRDLLDRKIAGKVIRFVLLSTHYRQPIDWTQKKTAEAETILRGWATGLTDVEEDADPAPEVVEALADDLNTPAGITALHQLARSGRLAELRASLALLGFDLRADAGTALGHLGALKAEYEPAVRELLELRREARTARDFRRADELRDGLVAAGVKVMDRPDAPSDWDLGPDFDPAKLEGLRK
ncbi:cysteine--tRNA ligase [Amaricoccus sp.]|uniref:cysteine--tRNA ligase n=1 Tax=Amaricoccus sp. TaxID=1872485 RepID=UPI001B6E2743|nr:cysteine--tRNA ligase [Amaricoccus sp.]MBP7000459.1 cysteine--tRNA ligase [Amaricoccus sp.]